MEQNFHIFAADFDHLSDPAHRIVPVQTPKSDLFPFTHSMCSLINQKHCETISQIIIRQPDEIVHPLTGISVETDDNFLRILIGKPGAMKFQSVVRCQIQILMRIRNKFLFPVLNDIHVLIPVRACHLHGSLHVCIISYHCSSVEIGRSSCFCQSKCSCQKRSCFPKSHTVLLLIQTPELPSIFCCQSAV